jgi:hypothetical protein
MSTPESAGNDLLMYGIVLPFVIVLVSCGFCIVYRRWFNIPILAGTDHTAKSRGRENDPGRDDWVYTHQGNSKSKSYPSIYSSPQQSLNNIDI